MKGQRYLSKKIFLSSGQMTVECAVVLPVVIVVGLICFSIMRYLAAVATFDSAAGSIMASYGAGSSQASTLSQTTAEIESALSDALKDFSRASVQVRAEPLSQDADAGLFQLFSPYVRLRATLMYVPWPQSVSVAQFGAQAPGVIVHETTLVIDTYKSGAVM